ncbi:dicarboxylate/amino acid:cation symporter [bacterium]|nr:dicarboxylate/amino acid:cation symporter [bacterium]
MKTHYKLLLALGLGAVLGTTLHTISDVEWIRWISENVFYTIGQVFLRSIFMIVVPMVFAGLVLGVYELGQHHGLGKVISKTLLFTVISSGASVLIGVLLINVAQPGKTVSIPQEMASGVEDLKNNASQAKSGLQALIEIVPKNPLQSAVQALDGEMLALMFFALVFGLALSRTAPLKEKSSFISMLEELYAASLKIVDYVMSWAPYAVFALVFTSTFKFGYELLLSLFYYVLVVVVALLLQQFVIYAALLKVFSKRSPWKFFKDCREVYIYAFATSSSNATLPKSLELAEKKLGITPAISRFVLTVGSTANQNGTALFEGITVLFLAQVYGVELSFASQAKVVLMSVIAGVGTAGVPGGSLPLIMIVMQQVGVPVEGLGLILGVDRFLDMCRTTINVSGDLVIAALVDSESKA